MAERTLDGLRLLVAEDEFILADDLRAALEDRGAVVIGPAPSVAEAMDLVQTSGHLDGAILDVNLGGERIFPVADELERRGIVYVFTTGYDRKIIPPTYAHIPCCEKPISLGAVIRAIRRPIA